MAETWTPAAIRCSRRATRFGELEIEQHGLLAGDNRLGGTCKHQLRPFTSDMGPLQITTAGFQTAAEFHPQQLVEIHRALYVGHERHWDEARHLGISRWFHGSRPHPSILASRSCLTAVSELT